MSEIKLNKVEQDAKDYVLNLILKGSQTSEPCDESFREENFKLPEWFNEAKYKRGQNYFFQNRSGIMMSNLYGLFSLLSEPTGGKIMYRAGHSNTPAIAKKRYTASLLHMMKWYEDDLVPGSKSWESLKKVRKMHLNTSKNAINNGTGFISQTAMAMSDLCFMGYAIVRPHLLGIKHDNSEDRESFIHVWAAIGSLLGIKDEFNMCLLPLEVVETVCRILIRYAFIPFLQFETPTFKTLGRSFIDGMSFYLPFASYESHLFMTRRLTGVPGYQHDLDMTKELLHRQIFSADEVKQLVEQFQKVPGYEYRLNMVFDEKLHLLEIKSVDALTGDKTTIKQKTDNEKWKSQVEYLTEFLDLKNPSELMIIEVDESNLDAHLNDHKFHELSRKDQFLVNVAVCIFKTLDSRFGKPFVGGALSLMIKIMKLMQ